MNNPGISSCINSNQNTTCVQQVDFERKINENIIPTRKSSNPTELNICNENTLDNISPSVETLTCLEEFDKIFDNVRESKVPIGINTQCDIEIDIEGVHLNDLATLGDIYKSSVDNFDDWQNDNDFVKNTELYTVEYCSNNEEDRNGKYLESPIDNNEHLNLNTWKSIYEDFLAKTNDITSTSAENQTIARQHEHEILNIKQNPKNKHQIKANPLESNFSYKFNIEGDTHDTVIVPHSNLSYTNIFQKEYQGKCVRMQGQAINKRLLLNSNKVDKIANEIISSDDVKIVECNKPINKETNDLNSFKRPERKSSKCFKMHKKPTITTEKQDLESDANKICLNYSKNPTNTFEFKKRRVESINLKYLEEPMIKKSSNTKELAEERDVKNNEYLNIYEQSNIKFEKQENDSDCDGYNSSDFEFIDEDEATKHVLNMKSLFDESIYLKATTNNGPDFEVDAATTKKRPNFVCSEIKEEKGAELVLPSIESLFAIHDNQKAINFDEVCDENNIILDYFKTVEPTVNVNEFNNSYRDSHRIPNDDEFVNLFGGNFTSYPMFSFENKATHFGTGMTPDSGGGFDMSIFRDESTPEQRREAKESELKILAMYDRENRSPRRPRYCM